VSTKNRWTIWVGLILFVLMGLCPPWVHTMEIGRDMPLIDVPGAYGWLFAPPTPPKSAGLYGTRLDHTRLVLQWGLLVLVVTVGVLTFPGTTDDSDEE